MAEILERRGCQRREVVGRGLARYVVVRDQRGCGAKGEEIGGSGGNVGGGRWGRAERWWQVAVGL